jgi:hypothetical protein
MPHNDKGGAKVLIGLCMVAGFAALAGMVSVVAVLLLGLGLGGLYAATGFGAVAMCAGLWAAVMAFGRQALPNA